jgi:uncharacterized damage-inducible protein DinB
MSERRRILDLIDRAYRARAWHGPAVLEALDGVGPALAARRVKPGVHSIWELVEHVASWNEIVAERLLGRPPEVTPEYNFPPVTRTTPAAWRATRRRLARSQARLRRTVARFPEARLGRRRPKVDYTWSVLIHGAIHHQLYHAGQIALLRRALGKPVRPS